MFPGHIIQHQGNPSLIPNTDVEEAEVERFYEDLQDLLELIPKKGYPFRHRGLECKSRKSGDTKIRGKFGLGVQNEVGQRLTEFCQVEH